MSWQSETRNWAVASAAAFCLCSVGVKVWRLPSLPDLSATVTNLNATINTMNATLGIVNRPCGGGHPCGTLANVDKLVVKIGNVAVDAQTQVRQSGTLINAASGSLTSTSQSLNAQLETIGPLLTSARGVTEAIPGALAGIAADTHSVMLNSNGAVTDVRAFISQPAWALTLGNVQSITGSAAAITDDARKVSDKATADYLKPVPWYLWPVKRSGELLDVGAAVARHTP